jgi:hypothetical protein
MSFLFTRTPGVRRAPRVPRVPRARLSLSAILLGLVTPAIFWAEDAAAEPARTNNWNQWDDDARDGVMEGTTKLSLGVDYARVGAADHTVRLAFELEHLLRDRWGIVGTVALPLDGAWVAPASLGLRFHFLPKFPLDPFVGVGGGVTWLAPSGLPAAAAPIAEARAGLAYYYFGFFFAQLEGGYDFVRYGRGGVEMDRGGASFAGRLGVDF